METCRVILDSVSNIKRRNTRLGEYTTFDAMVANVSYSAIRMRGSPRLESGMTVIAALRKPHNFGTVYAWLDLATDRVEGIDHITKKFMGILFALGVASLIFILAIYLSHIRSWQTFIIVPFVFFYAASSSHLKILRKEKILRALGKSDAVDLPLPPPHLPISNVTPFWSVTITPGGIFMACLFFVILVFCYTQRNVRYDSREKLPIIRSDIYAIKEQGGDFLGSEENLQRGRIFESVALSDNSWNDVLMQRYDSVLIARGWQKAKRDVHVYCKAGMAVELGKSGGIYSGVTSRLVVFTYDPHGDERCSE